MVKLDTQAKDKKWTALAAFPGDQEIKQPRHLLMAICMCLAAWQKQRGLDSGI